MSDKSTIVSRIESKVARGDFLAQLLGIARGASAVTQKDFVENLAATGEAVREILVDAGMVRRIDYDPGTFWPGRKGSRYCFIDGGVANIEIPSAAPLGLRIGTYMVRPGIEDDSREQFNVALSIVDELFSADSELYGEGFEDLAKLRDAARIVAEISVVLQVSGENRDLTGIFLHGPLVNPVSPYGLSDFPPFTVGAYRRLVCDEDAEPEEKDLQFVPTYLRILDSLDADGVPVLGVVERSRGRTAQILGACLNQLLDRRALTPGAVSDIGDQVRQYGLNDAKLFDVVLNPGEYVAPVKVNRQGPENKWPDAWKAHIRTYPWPTTTYLKPSENSEPFRIEMLRDDPSMEANLAVVLHTSRLLPSYGFPVGLDIVDKYAKVPSWMSRSVRGQHAVVLLKEALRSGDPKVLAFAKRVLAAKGRDWLFRPSA